MGHLIERCDFLDVLEEAVTLRKPVSVELRDGTRFEDRVRDVVTEDGAEHAIFELHGTIPLSSISSTTRAEPRADSYAGKRVHSHDLH
jgi:Rho-binding antiterminator